MKPYIFKRRNLIHIIDLRETLRGLLLGQRLAEAVAARGGDVLFVGTKKQARDAVEREATRCGMPFVAERWPGGLLTNYVTIRQRLERLEELEEMEATGQIRLYSKKMISTLRREKAKILRNLGGVRHMEGLPNLLAIADPAEEHIAVSEARKLEIPIVALTDTDGDPDELDVVVPGNDDSIAAIEIFLKCIADAVLRGRKEPPQPVTPPRVEEESPEMAETESEASPAPPAEAAVEPEEESETGYEDSTETETTSPEELEAEGTTVGEEAAEG